MTFFRRRNRETEPGNRIFGPVDYVVAGLGNPGSRYGNTRHNTGYCALDVFAAACGATAEREKFHARCRETMLEGKRLLLAKPVTYMNLSGESVGEILDYYRLPPERLIVLSDDVSLPVGKMRIREKGSDGGHRGLRSILLRLGSDGFYRIRFGVGNRPDPAADLADWVLSRFTEEEGRILLALFGNTKDAVGLIMSGRASEAMSRYN